MAILVNSARYFAKSIGAGRGKHLALVERVGDVGTFAEKMKKLESEKYISGKNREVLEASLDAGNAAAHRGHAAKPTQVNAVMDIVENLLQAARLRNPSGMTGVTSSIRSSARWCHLPFEGAFENLAHGLKGCLRVV